LPTLLNVLGSEPAIGDIRRISSNAIVIPLVIRCH